MSESLPHARQGSCRPVHVTRLYRITARGRIVVIAVGALVIFGGCMDGEGIGPILSGCPTADGSPAGEPVTLTISNSSTTLTGVRVNADKTTNADVVITRVDNRTFTAVVTPLAEGMVKVSFDVAEGEGLGAIAAASGASCTFNAISSLGACCEGLSCELTEENECFFRDGAFAGNGTTCDPNPCVGACCTGINCAEDFTETECAEAGGSFQGNMSLCGNVECDEIGACCTGDGDCFESSEILCEVLAGDAGGTFMGTQTVCGNFTCPVTIGACCTVDRKCEETTEEACIAQTPALASAFQGAGFPCSDSLCSVPIGACCFSGVCQLMKDFECDANNGTYLGDNVSCGNPDAAALCEQATEP